MNDLFKNLNFQIFSKITHDGTCTIISFSMNTLLKNSHEPSLMLCGSNDSRKKKISTTTRGVGDEYYIAVYAQRAKVHSL